MQQAFLIDKIQKPNFSDYSTSSKEIQEVDYGLIDIDWINMLNIFN